MSRLLRSLLVAPLLLTSFLPVAAQAAPLGRVPLADSTASFDGYYGYDGKYHRPYNYGRPASPLDSIWRPPGYSRFGYGYNYGSISGGR